jgi:glucose/arabinose dehydrogenase
MTSRYFLLIPLILCVALLAGACRGDDDGGDSSDGEREEINPFGLEAQVVASAPDPVGLTFAPDGRLFFAEKYTGRIRVVDASGVLVEQPFAEIPVATWLSYQNTDWGLTGLALDPAFDSNHYVYVFYTEVIEPSDTQPIARPVLVRYTDQNNVGTEPTPIIDDFPETRLNHQGFKVNGALRFGPDGALYASVGDFDWNKEGPNGIGAGQDLSFPGGKILRIDNSGGALPDNPFSADASADARVFAYGLSQEVPLAIHPETGGLYATDGTDSCEELDIVVAGANYGWPDVGEFPYGDCYFGDQVDPIFLFAKEGTTPGQFQSNPIVSGLAFLPAGHYPSIGGGLLVCESGTGLLRRLVLGGANFEQVTANDPVVGDCERDVAVAPDGTIYYSNKTDIKRLTQPVATPAATASATP